MCYTCRLDPLEQLDLRTRRMKEEGFSIEKILRARAFLVKSFLTAIDENSHEKCDDGEKTITELKREQYNLSRSL